MIYGISVRELLAFLDCVELIPPSTYPSSLRNGPLLGTAIPGALMKRRHSSSVVILALVLLIVISGTASAYIRFYATTDQLALRSGPGTQYSVLQRVNKGTPLDVVCQVQNGTSVGGNRTWDKLTGGQWVSDYYTTTSSFNSYHPGLGDCNASPPPPPAATREAKAVAWAQSQVGKSIQPDGVTPWNFWCERFVENAYGTQHRYGSALINFNAQKAAGRINYSTNPPAGALVFYRNPYDRGFGHVQIAVGNGTFITTGPTVRIVNFSYSGTFQGWSYAPSSWPGR